MITTKNKKTIKRIIKICLFLLILAIILTNIVQCFRSFYYGLSMYEIENFWIYQKDFNTVAKFCMEMFESELKENDTLHQMDINCGVTSENEIYVTYYFREDTKSTELVPIDQTFYKSFKKVKQAFNEKADGKHYRFTNIIVYENFVRFDTYGPYRIYYSKNGTRPSLSNYYFFDRIRFHWYQAIYL